MPRANKPTEIGLPMAVADALRSFTGPENPPVHMALQGLETLTGPDNPPVHGALKVLDYLNQQAPIQPLAMAAWGPKELEAMQKAAKSLRKRSPVHIEVEKGYNGSTGFNAIVPGERDPVGYAEIRKVAYPPEERAVPRSMGTEVSPYFQRKGIASQLYDKAEEFFGEPVQPSRNLSGEGKAFWEGRKLEKEGLAYQKRVAELMRGPANPANEPIRPLQPWEMGDRRVRRGSDIEMMPTDEVAKYREFERDREGVGARPDSKVNIDELVKDIEQNGVASPLSMIYYQGDKTAILGEGNHRLAAALRMGMPEVPVRVTRYTGQSPRKEVGNLARSVPGVAPDRTGYVPADLLPSQIGMKSRPLSPAELAEDGRVIRGAYPAGFMTQAEKDAKDGTDVLRHIEEQKRAKLPPLSIEALIEELRWGK